jgi:hypothetical protein
MAESKHTLQLQKINTKLAPAEMAEALTKVAIDDHSLNPCTMRVPGKGKASRERDRHSGMPEDQPAHRDDISSHLTLLVPPALTVPRSDDTLVLLQLQIAPNLSLFFIWAPYHMFWFALDHAGYASKKMHLAMRGLLPAQVCDRYFRWIGESLTCLPPWKALSLSGDSSLYRRFHCRPFSILILANFGLRLHWFFLRHCPAPLEPKETAYLFRLSYLLPGDSRQRCGENPQ